MKKCFEDEINVPYYFAREFADAGGREIIPYLLEEMVKYEFYWDMDIYDVRLNFITNVFMYFRNKNMLTLYERYYIAEILEAKMINYVKKYQKYDLAVLGTNSNIWMFLNPEYVGQLSMDEINEILITKYRLMGLLE